EAGLVAHLLDAVASMHAAQPEASLHAVEVEQAKPGQQGVRAARAMHAVIARTGRGNEIDPGHHHASAVRLANLDDPRYQVVQIRRAEGARPAHGGLRIIAGADEIDVRLAIDLATTEEEGTDPPLADQVEYLDAAVGEAVVAPRSEDRQEHASFPPLLGERAGEEGSRAGDRRARPDGDMRHAAQQGRDRQDQAFDRSRFVRCRRSELHAGWPSVASSTAHGASAPNESSIALNPSASRAEDIYRRIHPASGAAPPKPTGQVPWGARAMPPMYIAGTVAPARAGSSSRLPSSTRSTVTRAVSDAWASRRPSWSRPMKTLPNRSAAWAWNRATSGRIARIAMMGSCSAKGFWIGFQSSRWASRSEEKMPRRGMNGRPFWDACRPA